MNLWKRAQNIGVKLLVGRQIRHFDAQQILHRTRDVVALHHVLCAGHGLFKSDLACLCMAVQTNRHICQKADAKRATIQDRAVSRNDPAPFQILHAAQASRW